MAPGKRTLGLVSQEFFYKIITWALLIVGLQLLIKAVANVDPLLAIMHAVTR